jgi:hypothetical protein
LTLAVPWEVSGQLADSTSPQPTSDVSVTDPQIEIDQLRVLLRPLTIEELKVVADTWHDHLGALDPSLADPSRAM